MTERQKQIEFAKSVCMDAGEVMLRYFGKIRQWQIKSGRSDIVTEADTAVEQMVRRRVQDEMPGYGMLGEEDGWTRGDADAPVWIVDPIDGTRNFAYAIPTFAISIACLCPGGLSVGAIYDPVHKEMFFAEAEGGAKLNGIPISVSESPDLTDSLISVSWMPKRTDKDLYQRTVARVNRHTSFFRRIGSAALMLAYIASGRLDGYVQAGINSWDIAAGMLIVQEAGGVVTDFGGQPIDLGASDIDMLVGNPMVHRALLEDVMLRQGSLEEEVQALRRE